MPDQPSVILSGFGDEAANHKTAEQQFAAFAAMGLQYYSLRFIDAGQGIKNVMQLSKAEITKNRYVPFKKYLNDEVKKACELAHAFETKLIRGFSFYHPRGTDPQAHLPQAV